MRVLVTGVCGFVGSNLVAAIREQSDGTEIIGIDNFIRPGTHLNRARLETFGCRFFHGDIRSRSDLDTLPPADWVIDAAANPSVLAGVDGRSTSRQVTEHNLAGTINLLEYCRQHHAGLILLSTSRVYSVPALARLTLCEKALRFELDRNASHPVGVTSSGVSEEFSTAAPVSLYGATKLASEILAVEFGHTFQFPVWINRCGVLAGAGQFGTAEQGIFAYWLHAWKENRPLRYLGFGGSGKQVRDAFHPSDLARLVVAQLQERDHSLCDRTWNVGGGPANTMSLAELSSWSAKRFGDRQVDRDLSNRPFDIPWLVMDSRRAEARWSWKPSISLGKILEEIAEHAERNPEWLRFCAA
jgi:CDP-paratose 2-epimerase